MKRKMLNKPVIVGTLTVFALATTAGYMAHLGKKDVAQRDIAGAVTALTGIAAATGIGSYVTQAVKTRDWNPVHWVTGANTQITLDNDDMTPEEMNQTFLGFGVDLTSNNGSKSGIIRNDASAVTIRGRVFKKCLDAAPSFSISPQIIENDDGTRAFAMRFSDPQGRMRVCMNDELARKEVCNTGDYACINISTKLPGGAFSLADNEIDTGPVLAISGGARLGFNPAVNYVDEYQRNRVARQRRQREYRLEKEPDVARYNEILADCADTPDKVELKRKSLDRLSSIPGVLASGEWAVINDQINREELTTLMSRINSVPLSELSSIEAKLAVLEAREPEMAANAYLRIADRYMRNSDRPSFRDALSTLAKAKDLAVSDVTKVKVEVAEWDTKVEQARYAAHNGVLNEREYAKLRFQLEKRAREVCGNGYRASVESCNVIKQKLQDAQTLPSDQMQGSYQRQYMRSIQPR